MHLQPVCSSIRSSKPRRDQTSGLPLCSMVIVPSFSMVVLPPHGLSAVSSHFGVMGFMSVLMGIGGGSFGVPLMSLYNVPIHRAVATAAGFGVMIAVPSVIGFLMLDIAPETRPPYTIGAVNLVAFAIVVAMTLMTAPLGVKLAHAMDPKPLKRVFAVFLTLVALNMLRKAVGW